MMQTPKQRHFETPSRQLRVTALNLAFNNIEGQWDVENRGVDLDIVVDYDPALVRQGKAPCLERAVDAAHEQLRKSPLPKHQRPAYPNYHNKRERHALDSTADNIGIDQGSPFRSLLGLLVWFSQMLRPLASVQCTSPPSSAHAIRRVCARLIRLGRPSD